MRIGIDDDHLTYREAGLRAQEAGVRQVALHARTAAQFYGGTADWDAIADLAELLDIPVLGNGDIWEADDALRMVRETGCAGVVVGRGCLGRPWLFADLARRLRRPARRALARTGRGRGDHAPARRAARRLAAARSDGVTDFRKHVAWYLKGFAVGGDLRRALASSSSLAELDDLLAGSTSTSRSRRPCSGSRAAAPRAARVGRAAGRLADQHASRAWVPVPAPNSRTAAAECADATTDGLIGDAATA